MEDFDGIKAELDKTLEAIRKYTPEVKVPWWKRAVNWLFGRITGYK